MRGLTIRAALAVAIACPGCFVDVPIGEETGASVSESGESSAESSAESSTTAAATTSTHGSTSTSTSTTTTSTSTSGVDTGTTGLMPCPGPCTTPPSACFAEVGECVAGECVYTPAEVGHHCDDGDPCTSGETCDGFGVCAGGAPMVCEAPNATGTCSDGVCGGWTCTGVWQNCDGEWANGCEVPTGVPNQCSKKGLGDPDACWTAYCGSSPGAKVDFGTYYCMSCVNCHVPMAGFAQWCSSDLGIWFPAAQGVCGVYEDAVCEP